MEETVNKTEESLYSKEELMANSRELFACTPEVLAGAWHGSAESGFTIEGTKELIQNFLQRKVQV